MTPDIKETTWNFDHTHKTVEFYTTQRSVFLKLMKRNPTGRVVSQDDHGWCVQFPIDQLRSPETLLKPVAGGEELQAQLLTPAEVERRAKAGARLKASRAARKAESP
jgi:hypothetical protein